MIRTDQIPAFNNAPLDLSGAYDSMLATSALSLACGEDQYLAGFLESIISVIQVSRVSNSPISKNDLETILD